MTGSLNYFLESALALALLLIMYRTVLARETNTRFLRRFMLSGLLASLLLPLVNIELFNAPLFLETSSQVERWLPQIEVGGMNDQLDRSTRSETNISSILMAVYFSGAAIALMILLTRLFRIIKTIYGAEFTVMHGFKVIHTNGDASFSFFHYIFLGSDQVLTDDERRHILRHEINHARARHSVDVMIVNVAGIILWFNPLMILYKRALTEIHEFDADAESIVEADAQEYCGVLAKLALVQSGFPIANHFNASLTLKRIHMIKRLKTRLPHWKVLLIAMISGLSTLFIACHEQVADENGSVPNEINVKFTKFQQLHPGETFLVESGPDAENIIATLEDKYGRATYVEEADFTNERGARKFFMLQYQINTTDEVFTVVENMPEFPDGLDGMREFLIDNIRYPSEARRAGISGTTFVSFIVEKNGAVSNVQVLRGFNNDCDQEAIRVVRQFPKWKPATQSGKVVRVKYVLPINFKVD